jgi:hypothetical protein
MKYNLLLIVLLLSAHLKAAVNMTTVRDLFARAAQSSEVCEKLHAMTADATLSKAPVLYGYHAAAEIIRANHAFWPNQKLGHFNTGKAMLEAVIAKNPKDVELRFVRFCVQRGCPFVLGYSSDKATDKQYVLTNMDKTDWTDAYKKKVRDFLNSSS